MLGIIGLAKCSRTLLSQDENLMRRGGGSVYLSMSIKARQLKLQWHTAPTLAAHLKGENRKWSSIDISLLEQWKGQLQENNIDQFQLTDSRQLTCCLATKYSITNDDSLSLIHTIPTLQAFVTLHPLIFQFNFNCNSQDQRTQSNIRLSCCLQGETS